MRRRTYLSSIAAVVLTSGCIGGGTGQSSSDQMQKSASVKDVVTSTEIENLEISVEVLQMEITESDTARIRISYSNRGDDPIEVNIDPDAPAPLSSSEEEPGLLLLSDAYDPTRASDECWKPEGENFPRPAVVNQYSIEPKQTVGLEYDIWANVGQEATCIEPGEYQFGPNEGKFVLTVSDE